MNLPTIVETYKTNDNSNYYKSADVGQMLVVHDVEKGKGRPRIHTDEHGTVTSGLCPPFRGIKKRFRQMYPNKSEISEVDGDLSRIKGGGMPGSVNIEVVEEEEENEVLDGTPARKRAKGKAKKGKETVKEPDGKEGVEENGEKKHKKRRRTNKKETATLEKEAPVASDAATSRTTVTSASENKGKNKKKSRGEQVEGTDGTNAKERKTKRKRVKKEEEEEAAPKDQTARKKKRSSPKKAATAASTATESTQPSAMDMDLALELESSLGRMDASPLPSTAVPPHPPSAEHTTVAPPPVMQLPVSISQPSPITSPPAAPSSKPAASSPTPGILGS